MSTDSLYSSSSSSSGRLLVVANRLPVSVSLKRGPDGKPRISLSNSSGGLVSALRGVGLEMQWIGWPGGEISDSADRSTLIRDLAHQNCVPVFLSASQSNLFYNGFCNNILWPLFHYLHLPMESVQSHGIQFRAYEQANEEFARVIRGLIRPNDILWIHDYHLMILPRLLRDSHPNLRIGFFFHTPFPSSELFRILPCRERLLSAVLASDLIGFHTHDYSRHFQSACSRICGAQGSGESLKLADGHSQLGTFPIGIEPGKFLDALKSPKVQLIVDDYLKQFSGRKVLLGIDRLDYIKGIAHKLIAFEQFLTNYPEWIGKCVLVQIAVPSRTDVPEYQRLRSSTHETVGRLNGKFGTVNSIAQPAVIYLDTSIPFDQMAALYSVTDVMLITSVRDGMNLVAYEFVSCQEKRHGVLILSEFAGASQSLAGGLAVNPWDCERTAASVHQALIMKDEEKKSRHDINFTHVISHTAREWANSFVDRLEKCALEKAADGTEKQPEIPGAVEEELLMESFRSSQRRLIVTGLSGLMSLFKNKAEKERRKSTPSDEREEPGIIEESSLNSSISVEDFGMKEALDSKLTWEDADELLSDPDVEAFLSDVRTLSDDSQTIYVLLTSRSRVWCDKMLGQSGCWAVAENGFFFKAMRGNSIEVASDDSLVDDGSGWHSLFGEFDFSWKPAVQRVFEYFSERTPNSFIEQQETSIAWNFNSADQEFAKRQALDLGTHLRGGMLANTATEIVEENGRIEVRPTGIHRARAIKILLQRLENRNRSAGAHRAEGELKFETGDHNSEFDFLLCVGSFAGRDDEIFSLLQDWKKSKNRSCSGSNSTIQSLASTEPSTAANSTPGSPSTRNRLSHWDNLDFTANLFSPANFTSHRVLGRNSGTESPSAHSLLQPLGDSIQSAISSIFPNTTIGISSEGASFSFSPAPSPHCQSRRESLRRMSSIGNNSTHHFPSFDLQALLTEDSSVPHSLLGTPIGSAHHRVGHSFEALEAEIDRIKISQRNESSHIFTINVGSLSTRSKAKWNLPNPILANNLIHKLAEFIREINVKTNDSGKRPDFISGSGENSNNKLTSTNSASWGEKSTNSTNIAGVDASKVD